MPHLATIKSATTGKDDGAGTTITYSVAQDNVPCRENITGSSTRDMFARQQVVVSATISFLTSTLTTALVPGMKIETNGRSYHVTGITLSQGQGTIPSITRAMCEDQL